MGKIKKTLAAIETKYVAAPDKIGPRREKPDFVACEQQRHIQPGHPRRLLSAFVFTCAFVIHFL